MNKFKYRNLNTLTQEECKEYLQAIGYGEVRDYPKIYVNGMATNWAESVKVAKIAYKARYGVFPSTVEKA